MKTQVTLFQFLMVRLKAIFLVFSNREIIISIPYGAIKSRRHHLLKMA